MKIARLLPAGLDAVPPLSPVMMSAAQCVMLTRSAARAERTEALKETKSLAKRKCFVVVLLLGFLTVSLVSFGLFCLPLSLEYLYGVLSYAVICLTTCCYV